MRDNIFKNTTEVQFGAYFMYYIKIRFSSFVVLSQRCSRGPPRAETACFSFLLRKSI